MRTFSLALALTIGLVGYTVAQLDKPINDWKAFGQPSDEFSLEVPERFEYRMLGGHVEKIRARGEFHSESERFYLFIDPFKDSHQRKQVEAYLRYANQTAYMFSLDGHDARKVEFEDSTGFYHRIVLVETASRIFTLHTVSHDKNSGDAARYVDSFRLQPKSLSDDIPEQPGLAVNPHSDTVLSLEAASPVPVEPVGRGGGIEYGGGQGTGRRSGSGNGPGSGSGVGNGASPATPTKITAPLKITYKQKASYTDFARFYSIQGTVTLRATFLTSGQIGSVTTIKKLPFGLTEAAIHAAKKMRFEPEMVNGVARTTTRPVSFTFNIY